jgi:hypothetical protein
MDRSAGQPLIEAEAKTLRCITAPLATTIPNTGTGCPEGISMSNCYTRVAFLLPTTVAEARLLLEIERVGASIDACETPEDEVTLFEEQSGAFRAFFAPEAGTSPLDTFLTLFEDRDYPTLGCSISLWSDTPDGLDGPGTEAVTLFLSGDQAELGNIARVIQRVSPSSLPFRFSWASDADRACPGSFTGGVIEVTPCAIRDVLSLHDDVDPERLVMAAPDADQGLVFWNRDHGFGGLHTATIFTSGETALFEMPDRTPPAIWLTLPH